MLSTFPAVSSSDGLFRLPFPAFQDICQPWDSQELVPIFQQFKPIPSPNRNQEPVYSNSGSNDSNPRNINRKRSSWGLGSEVVDMERKQRRMISNRESARRSRVRKQRHVENMRNEVNRLQYLNRNVMNRLHVVIQHTQIVESENEGLKMESVMLQEKLCHIHQLLLVQQFEQQLSSSAWPCNNDFTPLH